MLTRLLAPLLGLGSALILGVALWPEFVGLQRTWPWAGIVALRGAGIVAAFALILLLLLISRLGRPVRRLTTPIAFWLLIFMAASVWILNDRGWDSERVTPPEQSVAGAVTVLSWNTMGDKPAALAIAELALAENANVVALSETSAETAHNVALIMQAGGITMREHVVAFDADYIAHSTVLLIAESLGDYRIDDTAGNTAISPSIIALPVNGLGPTLVAAHAVAPNALSMGLWRGDLSWLETVCQRENVILVGDLNATNDNLAGLTTPGLPNVQLGSCTDAALATNTAAIGTWPAWVPALLAAPIDHVMYSRSWQAASFAVLTEVDTGGSDHRPIVATLTVAD